MTVGCAPILLPACDYVPLRAVLARGRVGPLCRARQGLATWQTERVLAYIEARLDMPLRAAELATVTRLSLSHFSRCFKVTVGQAPHEYVLRRRVERAKRLMLSDDAVSLAEIALRCGLSDQAHLSRVFRRFVAESPGAWQRRNRALADTLLIAP